MIDANELASAIDDALFREHWLATPSTPALSRQRVALIAATIRDEAELPRVCVRCGWEERGEESETYCRPDLLHDYNVYGSRRRDR